MVVFPSIEFESEEERRQYLVAEFPRLVKEGKFVQAMGMVQGNTRMNWLFAALNQSLLWAVRKMESLVTVIKKAKRDSEPILHETA